MLHREKGKMPTLKVRTVLITAETTDLCLNATKKLQGHFASFLPARRQKISQKVLLFRALRCGQQDFLILPGLANLLGADQRQNFVVAELAAIAV